jgi:ATP-dependent RNA helicase RhlB
MLFTELDLDPKLQQAIADRGYTELTSVQEKTLDKSLKGQDVAVQSQTGTGKTAAFLITRKRLSLDSHVGRKPFGKSEGQADLERGPGKIRLLRRTVGKRKC